MERTVSIGKVKQKRLNEDVVSLLKTLGITDKGAVESAVQTKANEALNEAGTTDGGNWVPQEMARNIIKKARASSDILSRLPNENIIEMKSKTWNSPIEGTDPTFYAQDEEPDVPGTAVTTSKPTTPEVNLTAKKYSASVYISGELDEDADVEGGLRQVIENKFAVAYTELIEKAIINGDVTTAGTGNVNSDDGAPASGSYYLHQNGLVKHALDESNDVSFGSMDASDFTGMRKQLGKHGLKVKDLLWLLEPETYFTVLDLAQVQTADTFGRAATIIQGELERLQGIEVMTNSDFGKAEADGKLSTTGSNNTLGRALLLYLPGLVFGWRRRLKITVKYLDETDQFRITGHTRFGFDMAEADQVALGRNITV